MKHELGFVVACAVALTSAPSQAFVRTCHQDITTEALAGASWPLDAEPPALSGDYVYLPGELSIDVAPEVRNLWAMSVLAGNQYSDQGSYERFDVVAIAERAARPELQREHCLRGPGDDGSSGDASALASCKAFILEEIAAALGDDAEPDLDALEVVNIHLVFRGPNDVPFQRFGFHLGRAVHALQDSFTHTFRTPDERRVRSVLNWVDWVARKGYEEDRDGFQHVLALDQCGASDEGGLERRAAALEATAAMIAAVVDDSGGRGARLARAEHVLDEWFGIEGGCTAANNWCDAPERELVQTGGCAVGRTGGRAGAAAALLTLLALLGWRRRGPGVGVVVALVLAGFVGAAQAQDPPPQPAQGEVEGGVIPKASASEQRVLVSRPWGILVKAGVGIDNGAGALGVGARYDVSKLWTVGLGVNWCPWISLDTGRTRSGTADIFVVNVLRINVRDYLEVHATLGLGISVLLFDTFAAQRGSFGPYVAISPLGVAFRMTSRLRLLVEPAEIVIPVPQTRGIPLIYRQHRLSVALQANF